LNFGIFYERLVASLYVVQVPTFVVKNLSAAAAAVWREDLGF
jgi:hypothetical protein